MRHAAHRRNADSRRPPAGPLGPRPRSSSLCARSPRAPSGSPRCALAGPARLRRAASSRSTRLRYPAAARSSCCTTFPRRGCGENPSRLHRNVSHELRTPLTSIQGYVETLIEDPQPRPETTHEFLGIILKNANRMNRLTEICSPWQASRARLQAHSAACTRFGAASGRYPIPVRNRRRRRSQTGIGQRAGGPGDGDPDAMHQVFGNLIENSLKYAKSGKRILAGAGSRQPRSSSSSGTSARHRLGASGSHLRALLPRGQSPLPRIRGHRARSGHRQAHRPGPWRRLWAESELAPAHLHFTLPLAAKAPNQVARTAKS